MKGERWTKRLIYHPEYPECFFQSQNPHRGRFKVGKVTCEPWDRGYGYHWRIAIGEDGKSPLWTPLGFRELALGVFRSRIRSVDPKFLKHPEGTYITIFSSQARAWNSKIWFGELLIYPSLKLTEKPMVYFQGQTVSFREGISTKLPVGVCILIIRILGFPIQGGMTIPKRRSWSTLTHNIWIENMTWSNPSFRWSPYSLSSFELIVGFDECGPH